MNRIFAMLVLGVLLSSCSETPFYDKTYAFKDRVWEQPVKPKFTFKVEDTSKMYDLSVSVRTTTDYAFNNMWIFIGTETPSGQKVREPYEIHIANPDGSWSGTKTGTTVENVIWFRRRKFPEKGTYHMTLEQGITEEKLREVLDIGIHIYEAGENTAPAR